MLGALKSVLGLILPESARTNPRSVMASLKSLLVAMLFKLIFKHLTFYKISAIIIIVKRKGSRYPI